MWPFGSSGHAFARTDWLFEQVHEDGQAIIAMDGVRSRNLVIAVLAVVCLVLAGTTTWALATRGADGGDPAGQEFWVSPEGDDDASGSEDNPWATLQHAVDESDPGTTIVVRGGTYEQLLTIDRSGETSPPHLTGRRNR